MNGPYPDILFHFTSGPGLKGILAEGFRVSYARERIVGTTTVKQFAVPIVSFCDLRLSELPFHMSKYGSFGIGMKKSWAQTLGLNPVAYANKDSEFTNSLFEGIDSYFTQTNDIQDWGRLLEAQASYMKVLNALRYVKNYEGDLIRGGRTTSGYRYADEREWRHVLPLNTKNILPFVAKEHIETPAQKKFFNAQLVNYKLPFVAGDVKYIVVPAERNIPAMKRYIEKMPLNANDKLHLSSRILTAQQVRSDM